MPLSVGDVTLGEMLRGAGFELALAGKTHVVPDRAGLARLLLDGGSELGHLLERGGFTELDRYDGHHTPHDESGYPLGAVARADRQGANRRPGGA